MCKFKEGDLVYRPDGPPSLRSNDVVRIRRIDAEDYRIPTRHSSSSIYPSRGGIRTRYILITEDAEGNISHQGCSQRNYSRFYRAALDCMIKESGFKVKNKKTNTEKVMQIIKEQQVKVNGKSRKLTIVVAIVDDEVRAGYSVKLPSCKKNPELAKTIALGRAMSDRTNLVDMEVGEGMDKKFILYAIAEHLIKRIEGGSLKIKGIR